MIGDNYKHLFEIVTLEPWRSSRVKIETKTLDDNDKLFSLSTLNQYISFGQIAELDSYADYSVKLDFGDNGQSKTPYLFVVRLSPIYKTFW
jgi:hypothetical protein